jgi:hypothetical protein
MPLDFVHRVPIGKVLVIGHICIVAAICGCRKITGTFSVALLITFATSSHSTTFWPVSTAKDMLGNRWNQRLAGGVCGECIELRGFKHKFSYGQSLTRLLFGY